MAKRIKSGIKRTEIAERNRQKNVAAKSAVKTAVRKVAEDLKAKASDALDSDLKEAISKIDKAVSKGILHKNTAGRKKSRLMKKVNSSVSK